MASKKDNYINRDFSHDRDKFQKDISIQARAFIIADEIAKGVKYRQIVSKYMDEWGVSYNYMHSIITESINLFKSDEIYKNLKEINIDRLTGIYEKAMNQEDLDTAIKAVDKLNKTAGIYDDKPVVAVQADDSNITITFGGMTVDQLQNTNNTDTVPYNEADSIIQDTLKNEDE